MRTSAKRHHFVAQFEQRESNLATGCSARQATILEYPIVDRDKYELGDPVPRKVRKNLATKHLYRIGSVDGTDREYYALEPMFQRYETEGSAAQKRFLAAVEELATPSWPDVRSILRLQFLNVFRNPYCIQRTLNTIGSIGGVFPNTEDGKRFASMIDRLSEEHVDHVCAEFQVTEMEYRTWLRALYSALFDRRVFPDYMVVEDRHNVFDETVDTVLLRKNHILGFQANVAKDPALGGFLLSDRGPIINQTPDGAIAMRARITSNVSLLTFSAPLDFLVETERTHPEAHERYHRNRTGHGSVEIDQPGWVGRFNRLCVDYSFRHVYCSDRRVCFDVLV